MLALTKEAAGRGDDRYPADGPPTRSCGLPAAGPTATGPGPRMSPAERRSEPEPEDVVVEGLPMAVEQATIGFLDDKVLDAEVVEGGVQFKLYQQPEEGLPEEGLDGGVTGT